jgi:hypothetical protein
MREFSLYGRIDELSEINTPLALLKHLKEVDQAGYVVLSLDEDKLDDPFNVSPKQPNPLDGFEEYYKMYQPLGLSGSFRVTGIEGKNYDGYVPGKRLIEGTGQWMDAPDNDLPWVLMVQPEWSMFNIMEAVAASEYNGYPDVNHLWFEGATIDEEERTIKFNMGS